MSVNCAGSSLVCVHREYSDVENEEAGADREEGNTCEIVNILINDDVNVTILLPIMGANIGDGEGFRHDEEVP
jgi:hypothetical protein